MESLTAVLAFLVALSLATERVTETIKRFPLISNWLFTKRKEDSPAENARMVAVQILAIGIGTFFASQLPGVLSSLLKTPPEQIGFMTYLLFGALGSGGSGMWNEAVDIIREVKKQKEILTQEQKAKAQPAAVPAH